jgi:hypothetical protein
MKQLPPAVRTTFDEKMEQRSKIISLKLKQKELRAIQKQKREELRKRQEANRKRREENELKGMTYDVVSNF